MFGKTPRALFLVTIFGMLLLIGFTLIKVLCKVGNTDNASQLYLIYGSVILFLCTCSLFLNYRYGRPTRETNE